MAKAVRLEAAAEPGRVRCSEAFARALGLAGEEGGPGATGGSSANSTARGPRQGGAGGGGAHWQVDLERAGGEGEGGSMEQPLAAGFSDVRPDISFRSSSVGSAAGPAVPGAPSLPAAAAGGAGLGSGHGPSAASQEPAHVVPLLLPSSSMLRRKAADGGAARRASARADDLPRTALAGEAGTGSLGRSRSLRRRASSHASSSSRSIASTGGDPLRKRHAIGASSDEVTFS